MALLDLDTDSTLLFVTAAFALAYLAGTAAALRLLTGWGRFAATMSVVASAGLLAVTGWHVLLPVGVGCLGVLWARRRARVRARAP
jgi:hypothetical protein